MLRYIPHTLLFFLLFFIYLTGMEAQVRLPKKPPENPHNEVHQPDLVANMALPDAPPSQRSQPSMAETRYRGPVKGNGVNGIDVSHYQKRIDWDQVAREECSFVYVKASEGESMQDDTYQYNFNNAQRVGMKVGSYHFFRANVSAYAQLRNFTAMVNKKKQDLLPLIDVEVIPRGMSSYAFCNKLEEFLELVTQEFGKRPLVYTGRNFYNKHLAGGRFRNYKFMIASYSFDAPVLSNNDDYLIWQFTGSGTCRGISGEVDKSCFVGRHTLREIFY